MGEVYWWRVCYQQGLPRLVSIPYSWQDSADHVGCNNSCSPAFHNLMAEPAVSCDSFELQDVPREAVKSEQKCADFEIDL